MSGSKPILKAIFMNNYQLDRWLSYGKSLDFLKDNPSFTALSPRVAPLELELKRIVADLGECAYPMLRKNKYFAEGKRDAKAKLCKHMMRLVRNGVAYAFSNDNVVLEREIKTAPSTLSNMREAALYTHAQALYEALLPHAASLPNGAADLATLQLLRTAYFEAIQLRLRAVAEIKLATITTKQLMKDAHRCRRAIDTHLAPLQYIDEGLYREWQLSNGIDNINAPRKKKPKPKLPKDSSTTPSTEKSDV